MAGDPPRVSSPGQAGPLGVSGSEVTLRGALQTAGSGWRPAPRPLPLAPSPLKPALLLGDNWARFFPVEAALSSRGFGYALPVSEPARRPAAACAADTHAGREAAQERSPALPQAPVPVPGARGPVY